MSWNAYLAVFLALVSVGGSAIYIKDTLKGATKPNRVTYLLWSVPIVAGVATVSQEFSWASVMTFLAGLMPFLVFAASFVNKNAYWKLGGLDYACGVFAAIAIALWMTLKDPALTIAFCILADGLASVPTLRKGYKYPETETKIAYLLSAGVYTANLLNVESWTFVVCAFPLYLAFDNWALAYCVYHKSIARKRPERGQK